MKKLLLLICLISVVGLSNSYANNSYYVNDIAVEDVLTSGVEVNPEFNLNANTVLGQNETLEEKNALVAILLDIVVGGFGIHRVYLDGRPTLILIYFITCGGIFGIVPLVDLIVLAINFDDISQFVGNDKFIMW